MILQPHITVASIIPHPDDITRFLMVEEGENVFNQPAGHLECNETLAEAAMRETLEETAWKVVIDGVVGVYHWQLANGQTFMRTCFFGQALAFDNTRILDSDIIRSHWMSLDDLHAKASKMRSPLVIDCLSDYLKGCRYSLDIIKDIF